MISFGTPAASRLFDNETFDRAFLKDIYSCRSTLLIESPFIRLNRVLDLLPTFERLRRKGVRVVVNTRPPEEHDEEYEQQAMEAVSLLQSLDVEVLFTIKHHRKIAIIDRETFWEGSLNILSYYDSCEIMRRTVSATEAESLIKFIGLNKYLMKVS
jgi:phosphatidylserine/phosphatidylglycerophosphate/cardiolipin synthase-like enzyme